MILVVRTSLGYLTGTSVLFCSSFFFFCFFFFFFFFLQEFNHAFTLGKSNSIVSWYLLVRILH